MALPKPKPGILDIQPYVGGLHSVQGVDEVVVLASNETPLGPSQRAMEAYGRATSELHRYPDGGAEELRSAIGERFGLDADRIVCGAGSDELIALLVRAYAGAGDEVLYGAHGFLMYAINARGAGATPVPVPEKDLTFDVDAVLARVTDRTRMVFIANPNNPTGSYIPSGELERLRAGLRDDILLVIDAAYAEYVTRNDYASGAEMVERHENVVMTRTFSKVFGLAALRLGWAYCPPAVADALNRVRSPFNVTVPAQLAGIAAVGDVSHTDAGVAHNDRWLPWFAAELQGLGIPVPPSAGNFVLARFPNEAAARAAYEFLLGRGVITRLMGGYGLPESLRITIGTEPELRAALDGLNAHRKAA